MSWKIPMLRESREQADRATGICPVCRWPYGSEIIYCSSCGTELVRLKVSPEGSDDEPLGLFAGFPLIMQFENTGKVPVALEHLGGESLEWGEWDSGSAVKLPVSLQPAEKIEIHRYHRGHPGQQGQLTLRSTLPPISLPYLIQQAPRIWLADDHGQEFDQGTDEVHLWLVDQDVERFHLTLHASSETVLAGPPYLSGEDPMVEIVMPPEAVHYPFYLEPAQVFQLELARNRDLSEEGCPVSLVFPFKGLGEVDFCLNLKSAPSAITDEQHPHSEDSSIEEPQTTASEHIEQQEFRKNIAALVKVLNQIRTSRDSDLVEVPNQARTSRDSDLIPTSNKIPSASEMSWDDPAKDSTSDAEEFPKRSTQVAVAVLIGALVLGSLGSWYIFQDHQHSTEIANELEELERYEKARDAGLQALKDYVARYPNSPYVSKAEELIQTWGEQAD